MNHYDITPEMESMLFLLINGGRLSITPSVRIVSHGDMHEFRIAEYLWLKNSGVIRERHDGKLEIKAIVYADIIQRLDELIFDVEALLGWAIGSVSVDEKPDLKNDWVLVQMILSTEGCDLEGSPAGFTVV
ncbi:hypothetical protein [Aeromonas jandaei]|uniref:hypothetical protein n=1 Tax=Aeromonas jandaei TaxID=650 RepID=UPI003B9DFCB0